MVPSLTVWGCSRDKLPLYSPGQTVCPRAVLRGARGLLAIPTSWDKALSALGLEDTEKPELSPNTKPG